MESEMKRMLERIPKEKHEFALQTLTIIASIKDECKTNRRCENCRFFNEKEKYYSKCIIGGNEDLAPEDWNEYNLVERIYK